MNPLVHIAWAVYYAAVVFALGIPLYLLFPNWVTFGSAVIVGTWTGVYHAVTEISADRAVKKSLGRA